MKIGILAPCSRPWDSDAVDGNGMNLVIRESCEALAGQGHTLKVFIRQSRNIDKQSYFITKNIEVIFVDTGTPKRLDCVETYYSCLKNSFPVESIINCDFIIAHYWVSEAWINKILPNYYSKVLYFSHSYFLNPEKLENSVYILKQKVETSLLSKVVWCANTKKEFITLKSILEKSDRIAYIPLAINYKSFSKKEIRKNDNKIAEILRTKFSYENFVLNIEKAVLQKELLYKGKVISVHKTPIMFKGKLIPFEKVDLSGSVHVIPITDDGRIIFINELKFNEKSVRLKTVSGIIDQNEKPIETAKRELEEETGIKAKSFTTLMKISDTGTINDTRYYFIAKDLDFSLAKKEVTEDIREIVYLTKDELLKYLIKGKFGNTRSVVALLKLYNILAKG